MSRTELITVLVLVAGTWALIQFTKLKFWHAVVMLAAGFYLALTVAGSQIHHAATALLIALGH